MINIDTNSMLGITATDSTGQTYDVFSDYIFSELYIHEAVNAVPYFELYLSGSHYGTLFQYRDFTLEFNSENLKFKVPMGVINMITSTNKLMIRGWLVKSVDFRLPQTRFNGSSAKDALTNLGLRDQINYNDNLPGNFFQVNTTNLQQTLGICQMCAKTPYWNIGRYAINLESKTEESDDDIFASAEKIMISSNMDTLPATPDDNADFPWFSYSLNKASIDYHFSEYHDLHNMMLYNKKAISTGPKLSLIKSFPHELNDVVGTEYKNNNTDVFPTVTKWVLTSLMYRYNMHQVDCQAQYFGVTDAIEQQQFINDYTGR